MEADFDTPDKGTSPEPVTEAEQPHPTSFFLPLGECQKEPGNTAGQSLSPQGAMGSALNSILQRKELRNIIKFGIVPGTDGTDY